METITWMIEHLEETLVNIARKSGQLQDFIIEDKTNNEQFKKILYERVGEIESEIRGLWKEIITREATQ